ncbi:hypothetical protein QAD02_020628 [Eretmocerus hayati]|uniref:Uncharacterized protein n=1 Tax=Eretmocerus hayati TaxID=131215 RepID=A0ACC2PMK8_9HYME|nr:hypothetical protein QAD02_020628 [Eretmocerus hayati]
MNQQEMAAAMMIEGPQIHDASLPPSPILSSTRRPLEASLEVNTNTRGTLEAERRSHGSQLQTTAHNVRSAEFRRSGIRRDIKVGNDGRCNRCDLAGHIDVGNNCPSKSQGLWKCYISKENVPHIVRDCPYRGTERDTYVTEKFHTSTYNPRGKGNNMRGIVDPGRGNFSGRGRGRVEKSYGSEKTSSRQQKTAARLAFTPEEKEIEQETTEAVDKGVQCRSK